MRLFDHPGCCSGQCIWQAHGMACVMARNISDTNDRIKEERKAEELIREAMRLLEEAGIHKNGGLACREGE